jgi:hypothetical protein
MGGISTLGALSAVASQIFGRWVKHQTSPAAAGGR